MEADLKNLAHGFSSEQTHLVKIERISPESEGFWEIFGVLWTRFLQLRPATKWLFPEIRLCWAYSVLISSDHGLFKQGKIWLNEGGALFWRIISLRGSSCLIAERIGSDQKWQERLELRDFSFRSDRCCQDNFGMDQQQWRISFSLFEEQTKSWSWGVDN